VKRRGRVEEIAVAFRKEHQHVGTAQKRKRSCCVMRVWQKTKVVWTIEDEAKRKRGQFLSFRGFEVALKKKGLHW